MRNSGDPQSLTKKPNKLLIKLSEEKTMIYWNDYCTKLYYIKRTTIKRFEQDHLVKNRIKIRQASTIANRNKFSIVLQSFVENPHLSIRKGTQQNNVNRISVHKILTKNKFHFSKLIRYRSYLKMILIEFEMI